MSGIEDVGDIVTGSLVAGAIEPAVGGSGVPVAEAVAGRTHARACLNCGTALAGAYCHGCGQAEHVHRTLGAFGHDLLHGVLHFEGKIWRTLPMLAWRPGELTRRYVAGERARFVSPLALFLFCAFLTFAVIGATGGPLTVNTGGRGVFELGSDLDQARGQALRELGSLRAKRAAAVTAGTDVAAIDVRIADLSEDVGELNVITGKAIGTDGGSLGATADFEGMQWLEVAYKKAKANPSLLLYKLQNNAYKYSWLLIPLSVPFMWLLFPFNRRFHLYDHAVFVTYSLCFMTLLVVVASLIKVAGVPGGFVGSLLKLIPPIYIYRQLRGAYCVGRLGALVRTVLLSIFSVFIATMFLLILVALGVLG